MNRDPNSVYLHNERIQSLTKEEYEKHEEINDKIQKKIDQEYNDYIEVVCIEKFQHQLTVGKQYNGYLIKKHNGKDGVRIIIQNDLGNKEDYPIRWFKIGY